MKKLKTALWWLLIGWWWVIVKQILLLPVRLVGYGWLWGENKCQRLLRKAYGKLLQSKNNRAWVEGTPSVTYVVGIKNGSRKKAKKAFKKMRKIMIEYKSPSVEDSLIGVLEEGYFISVSVPSVCGETTKKILRDAGFYSPFTPNMNHYGSHGSCILLVSNRTLPPNITIY